MKFKDEMLKGGKHDDIWGLMGYISRRTKNWPSNGHMHRRTYGMH